VIQNNVNVVTTVDAIRVWAGKVVIGMIAIDLVSAKVNEKWDAAAVMLKGKEVKVVVQDAETEAST
jgi:nitrogen fixation protein FixH